MSEQGDEATGSWAPPPATPDSPLDDDDLLREILLRLPPQPSSLPRASRVSKRWRRLVSDPHFLRRRRAHHRKPPLLGAFHHRARHGVVFSPVLHAPDRIPPERFSLGRDGRSLCIRLIGCHHGRVLVLNKIRREVVVCDPITGDRSRIAVPLEFPEFPDIFIFLAGTVLCAAREQDHVHGSCHSSPFKVALLWIKHDYRCNACVYCSDTGVWGNLVSTIIPSVLLDASTPAVVVGGALYWLVLGLDLDNAYKLDVLEFDLDSHNLALIKGFHATNSASIQLTKAEDGGIGFAVLSNHPYPNLEVWQRHCDDVSKWVLWKTVKLHSVLALDPKIGNRLTAEDSILGYAEDAHAIFVRFHNSVFLVQLETMQSRRLCRFGGDGGPYHPFTSFYTADYSLSSVVTQSSYCLLYA